MFLSTEHLVIFYACTSVVQIVHVLCNFTVKKGKNTGNFFLGGIWPIIRNLYCRVYLEMLSTQPFPLELMFSEDIWKSRPMTQACKHGLRSMALTPSGRLSLLSENWKHFLFVSFIIFFFTNKLRFCLKLAASSFRVRLAADTFTAGSHSFRIQLTFSWH